eukprot:14177036-Alexandrium_andersonii.AAC.1
MEGTLISHALLWEAPKQAMRPVLGACTLGSRTWCRRQRPMRASVQAWPGAVQRPPCKWRVWSATDVRFNVASGETRPLRRTEQKHCGPTVALLASCGLRGGG